MIVKAYGEDLAYIHDAGFGRFSTEARVFERVHGALRRGGVLIFDIAEPGRSGDGEATRSYWTGKDWAVLVETAEDPGRRELTRQITSFRNAGGCYRREDEIHRLRLYEGSQVEEDLRAAGFKVRRVRGYGKLRFTGAHVGFIARKP